MADFGTPETWNMKVGQFIEEKEFILPEKKPQEIVEQRRKERLSNFLKDYPGAVEPETRTFIESIIKRNKMAIGGGVISGTDLGTREGFAGIRYNKKPLGGEGNEYIKTFETKGGEKRYLMEFSRSGINRKFTQPFTPEGLKKVKEERDKVVEEFKSKGLTEKSIKKLKNPPNPNKPWRYRQSVRGNQSIYKYFATEAEAKAAQDKVLEGRAKARFVSYKDELPEIKRLLKGGKTIKQVSEELDVPMSAIQKELGKIGKKASDFQPISYTEDSKLRKQFIKDYKKLSRSDLAKKLFPDDRPITADSKYGKLRETLTDEGLVEPKKRGELSEKRLAKVKTPFEAGKQKRERRTKKLVKLGSKEYENSLTKFKTEIGRLLGIKETKGPKTSFMPLDLSHRSDIRLLSRLGDQKITPGDLGLEFTEANRRGISRYKFGVKTLERKLEPLYAQQKRLFNKVANDGISKNLSNLIEDNNNKIDELFRTTDQTIASKLNPIFMNAETGEPFRLTPKGGRTLLDIGKPLEDVKLGGLDDFTIKRNYANQIVQVAKQEGLLDITDKEAQKVIDKYFEDASTRAPIKTIKRTIAGQVQEIPRGTEGFVPDLDLLREEVVPIEEFRPGLQPDGRLVDLPGQQEKGFLGGSAVAKGLLKALQVLGTPAGIAAAELGLPGGVRSQLQEEGLEKTLRNPVSYLGLPLANIGAEAVKNPALQRILNLGLPLKVIRAGTPVGLGLAGISALVDSALKFQEEFDALSPEEQKAYLEEQEKFGEDIQGAAEGGIMRLGLAEGPDKKGLKSPGRRKFMKDTGKLAGILALIPYLGKFLAPVAKSPAAVEGIKLGADKLMMLVDKIKKLGVDKTKNRATQDLQEVTVYQGKDGSEYELVEDLASGDIRVTKEKQGMGSYGDETFDTIEDRSVFEIKKGRGDETTKGTPPDEYEEAKEVFGPEGTVDDIDEIDDRIIKEIDDEIN